MKNGASQNLPDYKNPPVIEVACGVSFETIEQFKGPHLGLFWQKVRKKFPICEHAPRLEFTPISGFDVKNYMPRMWFINETRDMLIQLQNNKFYFNWRRIKRDEAYPRYSTIIKAFKYNLEIFYRFLGEEDLGSIKFMQNELTYINHIPKREGWEHLNEITGLLPDLNWTRESRFLPPPVGIGGEVIFNLPKDYGKLKVALQQGERKIDKTPILILQFSATGLGPDETSDSTWEWFEVAHEWIVRGFTDLTGQKVQKDIWQGTF